MKHHPRLHDPLRDAFVRVPLGAGVPEALLDGDEGGWVHSRGWGLGSVFRGSPGVNFSLFLLFFFINFLKHIVGEQIEIDSICAR